jgi:hypothetical protein
VGNDVGPVGLEVGTGEGTDVGMLVGILVGMLVGLVEEGIGVGLLVSPNTVGLEVAGALLGMEVGFELVGIDVGAATLTAWPTVTEATRTAKIAALALGVSRSGRPILRAAAISSFPKAPEETDDETFLAKEFDKSVGFEKFAPSKLLRTANDIDAELF